VASIIIPGKWLTLPTYICDVDYKNSLTNKLSVVYSPLAENITVDGKPITWETTPANRYPRTVVNKHGKVFDNGKGGDYYIAATIPNSLGNGNTGLSVFVRSAPNTASGTWGVGPVFRNDSLAYYAIDVSGSNAKQRVTLLGVADYLADGFYLNTPETLQSHGFVYRHNSSGQIFAGNQAKYSVSAASK